MTRIETFQKELEQESVTTRKMLALIPEDKFEWKPHAKSMSLQQLANHLAELPTWIGLVLNTTELDFAENPYEMPGFTKSIQLLDFFEKNLAEGRAEIAKGKENLLEETWTLRNGAEIYNVSSKYEFLRITFSQIIHHRAQLGVYLRLLNIPIPGSYGPSADEMGM